MLPDFTNLDPTAIAQLWIYVIGFFVFGVIIGWVWRRSSMKIKDDNFKSDKEKFEKEKTDLLEIKENYEKLKDDVKQSEEYWLYERSKKLSQTSGD
jgi:uncharacterized membrane-anchored protein YhcB (DUF1043 family)